MKLKHFTLMAVPTSVPAGCTSTPFQMEYLWLSYFLIRLNALADTQTVAIEHSLNSM